MEVNISLLSVCIFDQIKAAVVSMKDFKYLEKSYCL